MVNLQKLQDDIGEWSDETFGAHRNPGGSIAHLKKEVKELHAGPFCPEEYADCLMLLLDAARMADIDADQLLRVTRWKLGVNKKREWGSPDEDGVIEHRGEAEPEPPMDYEPIENMDLKAEEIAAMQEISEDCIVDCAYCGWKVFLHGKRGGIQYVICTKCGQQGPTFDGHPADAIADWNTRQADPELHGRILNLAAEAPLRDNIVEGQKNFDSAGLRDALVDILLRATYVANPVKRIPELADDIIKLFDKKFKESYSEAYAAGFRDVMLKK